jgi:hypothetical protein
MYEHADAFAKEKTQSEGDHRKMKYDGVSNERRNGARQT